MNPPPSPLFLLQQASTPGYVHVVLYLSVDAQKWFPQKQNF